MVKRKRWVICLSLILCVLGGLPGCNPAQGTTYYVSPQGLNTNPGNPRHPFQTVQKAISAAHDGDTVFIQSGTYDLEGLRINLNISINLIGEDKNTTILKNGRRITFHKAITVKNLQFRDLVARSSDDAVFKPLVKDGETIDGAVFDNLIVDHVPSFIFGVSSSRGTLKNITITNNQISNIFSPAYHVFGIYINTNGELSHITIAGNIFQNIETAEIGHSAFGILIGSDENNRDSAISRPHAIMIENNLIDHIVGGTSNPKYPPSGKGIMVYGEDITINNNRVTDINPAPAHEAIYIKGINSRITNNIVHNAGNSSPTVDVGAGDISIKGEGNYGNTISGNRITSDYPEKGIGILTKGGVEISNNYIKKSNGYFGIWSGDGSGKAISITNNYIETSADGGQGVKVSDADSGVFANNIIITYEGPAYYLGKGAKLQVHDNKTCLGFSCASLMQSPAPSPTGQ